ncbi:MAG: four helix bundle protein [Pirellulaceae bacterium]
MPGVRSFTDLLCWQRSRQWSKRIFELSLEKPFARDQRQVVQINDSSESVMSNIAEGFGRGTQAEFVTFLGYALGSLDETKSHLCAAYDRKYLTKDEFASLFSEGTEIRKMTIGLIQSMIKPGGGVKFIQKCKSWTEENWERYERITGKQRPEFFRPKTDEGVDVLAKDSFAKDGGSNGDE